MSTDDDRRDFPLGVPKNRPASPAPQPIDGRPNWYRDKHGREFYREPGQPMPASNPEHKP